MAHLRPRIPAPQSHQRPVKQRNNSPDRSSNSVPGSQFLVDDIVVPGTEPQMGVGFPRPLRHTSLGCGRNWGLPVLPRRCHYHPRWSRLHGPTNGGEGYASRCGEKVYAKGFGCRRCAGAVSLRIEGGGFGGLRRKRMEGIKMDSGLLFAFFCVGV